MNPLRVPLSRLAETPVFALEATVDERAIRPADVASAGLDKVRVSGVLSKIDTELYFEGTVSAEFDLSCDRCLSPTRHRSEVQVEWFFEQGEDSHGAQLAAGDAALEMSEADLEDVDGRVIRTFSGTEVDLGPAVWEELLLAMPWKTLCRVDCKGMCPNCGASLNEGACGCGVATPGSGHPGLARLKELYPDLPDRVED